MRHNMSTTASINQSTTESLTAPLDEHQSDKAKQYLTFDVANELYGVEILKVQEIRGWSAVTQMPNAPDFIRGVMNLRGSVVPIMDIRRRFNMPEIDFTPQTVVIVVNVQNRTIGMIVDKVSDVVDIEQSDVREAPDFGSAIDSSFLEGLSPHGEDMVILLNVDEMMKGSDLIKVDDIIQNQEVEGL